MMFRQDKYYLTDAEDTIHIRTHIQIVNSNHERNYLKDVGDIIVICLH